MIALEGSSSSWPTSIPESLINGYYKVCSALRALRGIVRVSRGSGIISTGTVLCVTAQEIQTKWFCSDDTVWSSGGSHQDFYSLLL